MLYRAFPLRGKLIVALNLLPHTDSAFGVSSEKPRTVMPSRFNDFPQIHLMGRCARLPLDLQPTRAWHRARLAGCTGTNAQCFPPLSTLAG
jgi:hypothetical protein